MNELTKLLEKHQEQLEKQYVSRSEEQQPLIQHQSPQKTESGEEYST